MKKKKIYATLRYARERLGEQQDDFAKLIGCGSANYANKENGRVPWSLEECIILRDYVNEHLGLKGEQAYNIDTLFFADTVEKKISKSRAKPQSRQKAG